VLEDAPENPNNLKAYVLAFMAVNLRDATRISDIDRELLSKLEIYCKNYFNASALFVRVTVSVWTLHGACYKYVPVRCSEDNFCYCGLPKECLEQKCNICSSSIYKKIIKSVEKGKVFP
jgi:hypothetical protein